MPFDPISMGLQVGGMALDLMKAAGAAENARRDAAYRREAIGRAAGAAMEGRGEALRTAGGLRQDQFGNATYYDPEQQRWVTYYTPTQRRLIQGGEERQGRAQARGAQASQDYDRLRGEYLFRRPKSEAESYAEIARLISQAQGTGERQLSTLMNRFGMRTAGNVPQLVQKDRGPGPGEALAETMLKARQAALEEYGTREKLHQSRYLPALKQFEETANYVAPVDPTGSAIVGMTQQGIQDMLKAQTAYDQLIGQIESRGAAIGSGAGGAGSSGPSFGGMAGQLAKLLQPDKEKAGTVGNTRGARAGSGGDGGVKLDNRFNYAKWGPGLGADELGGEGAPRGLIGEPNLYPKTSEGGFNDPNQITSFDPRFGDTFTYSRPPIPDYGDNLGIGFGSGNAASFDPGGYWNPWQF